MFFTKNLAVLILAALFLLLLLGCGLGRPLAKIRNKVAEKKENRPSEVTAIPSSGQANQPVAAQEASRPEAAAALPGTLGNVNSIVWSADFETGDLSQWAVNNTFKTIEADSGKCSRPKRGVTTEQAHSGQYSMKLVIDATRTAGCRQFRKPEVDTGKPYYYSAWFYIPEEVQVGTFWNIFQFKSNGDDSDGSDVFWKLEVRNDPDGTMRIVPVWKGPIPGPHEGDGIDNHLYYQNLTSIPVGQWFHLEVYLKQSENFDGHIMAWQDGIEILNEQNVRTKYPGGNQGWSVNNYGEGLKPTPTTLYIDDVAISTERLGPLPGFTRQ